MTKGRADYETPVSQLLSERLLSPVADEMAEPVQGVEKQRKSALKNVSFAPCPAAIEVEASLPYIVFRQLERKEQAEKACGQPDCSEREADTMRAHQQWARRPAAAISSSYATTLCEATEGSQPAPAAAKDKKSKKKGKGKEKKSRSKNLSEEEEPLIPEDTNAAALGKVIEADLQATVSPIETDVMGSFATSINDRKDVLETLEAATADGASCLEAFSNKLDITWVGLFPHEMQHVREGLLIFASAQKLMEDLKGSHGGTNASNALLQGAYTVKPGSTVKILDSNQYSGEQVFTVQAVEGTAVTLTGVEQAVDRHNLINAADPVETLFVDTALQGSWNNLEKEDTQLFSRLLDFAEKRGFADSLNVAKTTGNPSGLLSDLFSNSPVALLVAGVREILEAPLPSLPEGKKGSKGWKDISRTHSIFTAHAATKRLIPRGLLEGCGPDCLIKASMRKLWLDEEMQTRRKRYALKPKDLVLGDALRMSSHFSHKELTDLDNKLASAWLAAKLLLEAARASAGKLLSGGAPEMTAQPSASETSMESETTKEQPSASDTASTSEVASNESQASSLIENTSQEEPKKAASRTSVSKPLAAFVIGGNVNVNALNMITTFSVCKGLGQQGLPNLALLAQSAFTNIRGYVSAAGAGLQDTKQQRKMAKGSDVYSAIYQYFMCGFSGDLLPPVFAPFSSIALQVGVSSFHPLPEPFQSLCSLKLELCFRQLSAIVCRSQSEPFFIHFALCLCVSANFLRVELEESASLPWQKVVQAAGEGVFSVKNYDAAVRHLKNKSMKLLDTFTPCVAQVNEPTDLLQLQEGSKKKGGLFRKLKKLVSRTKGRRNQANAAMCEISGEHQQMVRMLVAWWTLGPMSSSRKSRGPTTVAETFRSARLLFANHIFFNGHDPVQIGMELIKAGCKSNKFSVPPGWAMGTKKGKPSSKPLSFKDISPRLSASLKYMQSTLGSADPSEWTMPLKVSQRLADSCGQSDTVLLEELLTTDEGSKVLTGYQCMILQEQAVKLISKVLGKKSRGENQGLAIVLLRFLDGLHVVKSQKNTKDILAAFERFVNTPDEEGQQAIFKEWNEDFPEVACAWKQNDRVKEAMLKKGTGYTPPPPPAGAFAAAVTDLHCPAATPLHVGDLAKASQPDARDFCTSSSAQCAAADFEDEYDVSLL
ncbi:hypothetical protein Emed_003213 [Eimeria media]